MKRIIFVIESMNIGGTEKALLSMLYEIPPHKYDITILLLENTGGFIEYIPDGVRVITLNEYEKLKPIINKSPKETILDLFYKKRFYKCFLAGIHYSFWRFFNNKMHYYVNQIMVNFKELEEEYDVAVSYQGPPSHFSAYFVAKKIRAKKKIQWIHSDVTKLNLDLKEVRNLYKLFDKFYVVSSMAKDNFLSLFPELVDKTEVFYNVISSKLINEQAELTHGFTDDFKGIRILTVGRLSGEKGQKITIPVLSKLIRDGYDVRWYCLGDGPLRDSYQKDIIKYDVEGEYILLGSNPNPYPYIKECDIYVQPSKFEGYCITLAEAKVFNKPIISTNFTGAREQLIPNRTGLIVDYDIEQLYESIKLLIENKNLCNQLSKNLSSEKIDTVNEINRLYQFIDGSNSTMN